MWRRYLALVTSFVIIGPPVGGAIFGALYDAWLLHLTPWRELLTFPNLQLLFYFPLVTAFGGYWVSGVSALACGVIYGFLALLLKRPTPLSTCGATFLGNLCAGAVWLVAKGESFWPIVLFATALSIPAALIARCAAHEGGPLPV